MFMYTYKYTQIYILMSLYVYSNNISKRIHAWYITGEFEKENSTI